MIGTRLRHISSKDLAKLEAWVERLPFKIEIKAVNKDGKQWFLHFTLMEDDARTKRLKSGSID